MKRKLNRIVQSNIYRCMIFMLGVHQKESDVRTILSQWIHQQDNLTKQITFFKCENYLLHKRRINVYMYMNVTNCKVRSLQFKLLHIFTLNLLIYSLFIFLSFFSQASIRGIKKIRLTLDKLHVYLSIHLARL